MLKATSGFRILNLSPEARLGLKSGTCEKIIIPRRSITGRLLTGQVWAAS